MNQQDRSFVIPSQHSKLPASPGLIIVIVLLSSIFLYLQVFVLPATPRVASGDQAIYLQQATRMHEGELIYRDYDHFTFPGTDLLYMCLFRLFGVRAWIPQAMLVVLGSSITYLIVVISGTIIPGNLALLPALLFLTLPFAGHLDASHHWYSTLFVMAALALLIEQRSLARLALAGALLGLSTFFSQSTVLVAAGGALFLLWEQHQEREPWKRVLKKEFCLLTAYFVVVAVSVAHFICTVGARRFLYYTAVFVMKYYPADWFNTWRVYLAGHPRIQDSSTWIDLPAFALIHLAVPFIYVCYLAIHVLKSKERTDLPWNRLMLINFVGIFLFLSVASAPAFNRLYSVSEPALILLVWLADFTSRFRFIILRLLWVTVLATFVARPLFTQTRWHVELDLPTGRTAFFEPALYEKCKWLSMRTQPSEHFFGDPLLAFALGLRPVGRVAFLRPTDYTRPDEVQSAIEGLEKFRVRFVSWYKGLDPPTAKTHPSVGDHLGPMRLYLDQHYHVAQTFSNGDEIWERNP